MSNISDTSIRLALTESFLDCDTSVEEERELARYYSRCKRNGCVPKDETEMCELVLATIKVADVPQKLSHRRHKTWLRIAFVAAAAAVAMALVMTFTMNDNNHATIASTTLVTKRDTAVTGIAAIMPTENEKEQQVSIASDCLPSHSKATAHVRYSRKCEPSSANIDMTEVYSVAASLFHEMSNLTIKREGESVLVSAVGDNGDTHTFQVKSTGSNGLTMTAI